MPKNSRFQIHQILMMALVLVCTSSGALAETLAEKPEGAGTARDPIRIETLAHLRWLSEDATAADLGKVYKLINDIDASETETWDHDEVLVTKGFIPIGGTSNVPAQFTGYFNGNNKTISNLYIDMPANRLGFVRHIGIGEGVRNLTLENLRITGRGTMGGLAGINEGAIVNVSVDVHMTVSFENQSDFGGLVGLNRGPIARSHAHITMEAAPGQNLNPRKVGGLVGRNGQPDVQPAITDSYATGKIQGLADIGGLVGDMYSGIVVSSFAAVEVTGSSGAVPSTLGGFFGFQNQGVLVTRSYWSPEISGRSSSGSLDAQASVQSRTKAQMLGNAARTHMSDLNFNNTWQTTLSSANRCTIGLPELRVLAYRPSPFAESTLSGGTGAIDDPCLIEDWNDLHKTRDHLSAAFALNGNLDNQTAGYADRVTNPSGGFGPIGTSSAPFTGSFNGRGHTIDGLEINRGSENHVGLFAALGTGATVDALALTDVSITGKNTVGGLAGEIQTNAMVTGVTIGGTVTSTETGSPSLVGGLAGTNEGQITDATSAAVVSGQSTTVGGLVGQNMAGTLQASSASGAVTGKGFVGGLVGRSQSGQITQSFATGNVTATEPFNNNTVFGLGMAGGLVGEIHLTDRLEQTASTGDIQGGLVGGLVGYAFGGAPLLPQITDSYSASTLIGSPSVAGGLVGKIESAELERVYFIGSDQTSNGLTSLVGQATNASVTQAYWDSDTTGIVANAQTLGEGKTTQELINRNTYSGWDFNSVWGIGGTREITYPFLRNIGNLDRPGVLLKLVSSTPDHNATGVALSPNGVSLTFNLNIELGDPYFIRISRNGAPVSQWSGTFVDLKTFRFGFPFQPNSTYRIALRPFGIRARANSRVSNQETVVVSFTTVPFANGDGTQASPYQIKSTTDWVNFTKSSDLWDKHFVLTQNINFPTAANRIIKLSPIGPFSGTLDGQGHFISNAVVQDLNSVDVGLFKSITSTGSIKDLHLVNAKVTGTQTAGLMAGLNAGTLDGVSAAGSVESSGNQVGGLVGVNRGLIQRSFATANITGDDVLGGLVGAHKTGTNDTAARLENVYANSSLVGRSDLSVAGGLVGKIEGTGSVIENAYSVSGIDPTPSSTTNIGGLVGQDDGTSTSITSSYYPSTWPGGNSAGGTSETEADLKTQATFSGWDFGDVWQIVNTTDVDGTTAVESHPYLKDLPYDEIEGASARMPIPGLAEKKYADGTGTLEDPFVIKNWRHLNNIRNETIANPHFKLAASLKRDTVGYAEYASAEANGGQGWAPIPAFNHGGFTYFVFDGDDYRISDLVIDRPSSSNVGLFAETKSDDMIFETIIENAQVSGLSEVGLLVGVNRGEIYNSSSTGHVEASDSSDSNSGGLVGINHTTGRIIRSYSLATVSGIGGGWYLGGLVGVNRGELTDCYAAGAVTGNRVGGLVGSNGVLGANDNASIDRCYAVAEVSSDNATGVGGLVGEEWTASTDIAPNSLWDIETSGQADPGDGGSPPSTGVGKTTAEMKSIATFTTALGSSLEWDFDNVWDIVNITQGDDTIVSYPFLRNNPQSPEPGRDYLQDFEPNNPGAGTDNDPYRITSWRHLANIARHPDAVFSLEQDLVASESDPDFVTFASSTANDGLGWLPIMGENAAFTGTLKGNDHSISGLVINRPEQDNIGLFAELGDDARIENLTIEATISGQSNIGVVAGFSGQATLDNVTVTNSSIQAGSTQTLTNAGAIDSDALESANAGGVIGQMDSGGSLVNASVTNTSINAQGARVGGLVGYLIQGSIQQSHATNTGVSGTTGVGGLVGRLSTRNNVPSSVIDESWARVNLNANDCPGIGGSPAFENENEGFGGLIGTAAGAGAIITKSYADSTASLGADCKNIGGLVGFSYSGTIENSYALGTITVGDGAQHVATILGNHVNTPIINNSYGAVSITTGTGSQHIGGLLGSVTGLSTGDLVDSFYSKDLPGNGTDDCDTNIGTLLCGEGKTDFELKERSTFANWSFDGASPIWQMASGDFVSYPYLVTPEQDPAPGLEGAPMVLEFDTTLGDGTTISLPFDADVDVRINWGDGNEDSVTTAGFAEHTYAAEGSYTVSIYGQLTHFGRRGPTSLTFPNSEKLTTVTSFGNLGIRSLTGAFKDATNLTAVPSALPDSVIRLRSTFEGATSFNGDLSGWDVSQVIDLTSLFFGATAFNQPIGGWNISNVRSLYRTFANAESFNQPLNDWDVSNIKSFNRAFYNARSFNQDLNDWQLISAQDTGYMFSRAAAFNGDITNWRTGTVKNMTRMFAYTEAFNQPIGGWDVSEVTSFNAMFGNAKTFNQPLNTWQPVKGENYGQMFAGAVQFNQPLNDWNVGQATNMRRMFHGARQFNQPLDDWNISNVEDFQSFLNGTSMSTQNYDAMLESFAAQSVQSDVTLEVGTIRYNEGAPASARAKLITDNNWTVIDGGMIPTFSGGNGEETAPHKISSLDDLRTLSEDPNSWALNFELTTSIDASDTATWNNGAGFSPIGDDITRFTGSFTGNGHQITGLVINRPNQSQVGLFGSVAGMVDSLSLIDVDITGNTEVGGLAGFNGGMVLDVAITGQIEGMVEIGGLVGVNGSLGHISSVASHADVTGSNMVGGVIGKNQGVLADGYATGILESSQTVGGLVGSFIDARSVIERGYSAATMTTSGQGQTPGGIIGSLGTQNKDAAGGQVRQSFFVGSLTPEGSKLPSFENYSINAATIDSKGLRSTKGPIGTDTDWAINGSNSEWAMLSVDDIQANGKFYRAYPYLRIFDYDEPGATATNLPLPGLIEMPMPPLIDRDSTSVSGDTLTLVFSVPQDSPDATVNGIEYSLDNGVTWQAASQAASPITVTGLDDDRAYGVRVRAQTDQGSGPMSEGYRAITGGRIFKDSFEQAPGP